MSKPIALLPPFEQWLPTVKPFRWSLCGERVKRASKG
jgi:hypothetical protein